MVGEYGDTSCIVLSFRVACPVGKGQSNRSGKLPGVASVRILAVIVYIKRIVINRSCQLVFGIAKQPSVVNLDPALSAGFEVNRSDFNQIRVQSPGRQHTGRKTVTSPERSPIKVSFCRVPFV